MTMYVLRSSGFAALMAPPQVDHPENWIGWHFTHWNNLQSIGETGALLCDDRAPDGRHNVGNPAIKWTRSRREVTADGYPPGRTVSAHVPFYFAAQSPMLFRKTRIDGIDRNSLIFLGVRVGDLIASGTEFCISDSNAASPTSLFSVDVHNAGHFVDFDLLTRQIWGRTDADPGRPTRRAAELLVHCAVPLSLVSAVGATTEVMARSAIGALGLQEDDIEKVVGYDLYF